MPRYPTNEEPISAAAPVTACLVPPIPVPSHGSGGNFSVESCTHVAASPLTVLNLVRDTSTWGAWNSFCPRAEFAPPKGRKEKETEGGAEGFGGGGEGWLCLGSEVVFDVHMSGDGLVPGRKRSRTQAVLVTVLERIEEKGKSGYRLAWRVTGWPHWQLHTERVMEFVAREEGGTEYVCWETFGGMLAGMTRRVAGTSLVERFGDYARDVKGFLEGAERGNAPERNGGLERFVMEGGDGEKGAERKLSL